MMNAYRAWLLCVALVLSAAPVQAQQIEGSVGGASLSKFPPDGGQCDKHFCDQNEN